MIEVGKDNFEEEVLEEDGVVLVDFWGEGCDRCLELMPEVEEMEEEYGDEIKFTKVKIKGNRRLAMRHQVMGLPSIVFFVDGEKLKIKSRPILKLAWTLTWNNRLLIKNHGGV